MKEQLTFEEKEQLRLAKIHFQEKEYDKVIFYLYKPLFKEPSNTQALMLRAKAQALKSSPDYYGSIYDLIDYLFYQPNDINAYFEMANIYLSINSVDNPADCALVAAKKCAELRPNDKEVQKLLKLADQKYRESNNKNDNNNQIANMSFRFARYYFNLGQYKIAALHAKWGIRQWTVSAVNLQKYFNYVTEYAKHVDQDNLKKMEIKYGIKAHWENRSRILELSKDKFNQNQFDEAYELALICAEFDIIEPSSEIYEHVKACVEKNPTLIQRAQQKNTEGTVINSASILTSHGFNDNIEINPNQLDLNPAMNLPILGSGGFGIVYKTTFQHAIVAVKFIKNVDLDQKQTDELKKEIKIMRNAHPNIVQMFGVVRYNDSLGIVMEFMAKGSLYSYIHSKQVILDIPQKIQFSLDIAIGLNFLHSQKIIHRDIKSLNILLTEHMQAKIADFGMSKIKNEESSKQTTTVGFKGTIAWMSPEALNQEPQTYKSDMYSYGVVVWEIFTQKFPHEGKTQTKIIIDVMNGAKLEIPPSTPEPIKSLINDCCELDPENRIDAKWAISRCETFKVSFFGNSSPQKMEIEPKSFSQADSGFMPNNKSSGFVPNVSTDSGFAPNSMPSFKR